VPDIFVSIQSAPIDSGSLYKIEHSDRMKAAESSVPDCPRAAVTDFAIGNQRGCGGEISVDHRFRQCGARDSFGVQKLDADRGSKFGCRGHAECKNIASERRGRRLAELLDPERTKLAARQSVEQIDADLLLAAWTHGPFPPWPCTLVSAALAFTNRLLRSLSGSSGLRAPRRIEGGDDDWRPGVHKPANALD
jgi:hypothetical protein